MAPLTHTFITMSVLMMVYLVPFWFFLCYMVWWNDIWGWLNVPAPGCVGPEGGAPKPPFCWGDFQTLDFGGFGLGEDTYMVGLARMVRGTLRATPRHAPNISVPVHMTCADL